ncbi:hypothetical protein ESZ00_06690 [Silvibacterium dinghuense]|uniref:Uncharacterized protein n=2 Tax=Silvibacterium dinghuense TaxID=1560006 RepID=A0A4Q1SL57_9BACT|nr:hypothetical protein ESZ00_06690 [Silvibacterium dinghuense]
MRGYPCAVLTILRASLLFALLLALFLPARSAVAAAKVHVVALGGAKKVPYSLEGDPAGATGDEKNLTIRPLVVDGKLKEWTTGPAHDITDRSFVVRRALQLNDALPDDKGGGKSSHWVWQKGPWLLIDRVSGRITALHLADYDPAVSEVVWFRDYAAYCGLNTGGHQLYAVVSQIAARRPLLAKKLGPWDPEHHATPACAPAAWQREPLRVAFTPNGGQPSSFDLVGLSAVLVEDGDAAEAEGPGR